MKRILSIAILIMLFFHTALLKTYAYDYRDDTLGNSDDKEAVMGLEEDILRRSSGNTHGASIDFYSAVKVYLFDADELIAFLDNGAFRIGADRQYVWKIPVLENDKEYRYTVAGHDENGSYGFTNVISPGNVEKQTPYIFGDIGLKSKFSNIEEAFVVSIPIWSVDFILVKDGGMNVIPYATRPDFFGFTNGTVYSPSDMKNFLEEYIRKTGMYADNDRYFYGSVGVSVAVLMISITVLIKKKGRQK